MSAIPFSYDRRSGVLSGSGKWARVRLHAKPTAAKRILNKLAYAMTAEARSREVDAEVERVLSQAVSRGLAVI